MAQAGYEQDQNAQPAPAQPADQLQAAMDAADQALQAALQAHPELQGIYNKNPLHLLSMGRLQNINQVAQAEGKEFTQKIGELGLGRQEHQQIMSALKQAQTARKAYVDKKLEEHFLIKAVPAMMYLQNRGKLVGEGDDRQMEFTEGGAALIEGNIPNKNFVEMLKANNVRAVELPSSSKEPNYVRLETDPNTGQEVLVSNNGQALAQAIIASGKREVKFTRDPKVCIDALGELIRMGRTDIKVDTSDIHKNLAAIFRSPSTQELPEGVRWFSSNTEYRQYMKKLAAYEEIFKSAQWANEQHPGNPVFRDPANPDAPNKPDDITIYSNLHGDSSEQTNLARFEFIRSCYIGAPDGDRKAAITKFVDSLEESDKPFKNAEGEVVSATDHVVEIVRAHKSLWDNDKQDMQNLIDIVRVHEVDELTPQVVQDPNLGYPYPEGGNDEAKAQYFLSDPPHLNNIEKPYRDYAREQFQAEIIRQHPDDAAILMAAAVKNHSDPAPNLDSRRGRNAITEFKEVADRIIDNLPTDAEAAPGQSKLEVIREARAQLFQRLHDVTHSDDATPKEKETAFKQFKLGEKMLSRLEGEGPKQAWANPHRIAYFDLPDTPSQVAYFLEQIPSSQQAAAFQVLPIGDSEGQGLSVTVHAEIIHQLIAEDLSNGSNVSHKHLIETLKELIDSYKESHQSDTNELFALGHGLAQKIYSLHQDENNNVSQEMKDTYHELSGLLLNSKACDEAFAAALKAVADGTAVPPRAQEAAAPGHGNN